MKFNTLKEANKIFRQYKPFDGVYPDYWVNFTHLKMGEWFIFQHIIGDAVKPMISRPILALCVGHTIWDQALVIEFVEEWRPFHYLNYIGDYQLMNTNKSVEHIQFWTDDIKVLGKWKTKPNFKQIRKSLKHI